MTQPVRESTRVVVVGAGPAGLTVATLLQGAGVPCTVLEQRSRARVLQRQRAGIVETRAVRMFQEYGLADRVLGGAPSNGVLEIRTEGERRFLRSDAGVDGPAPSLCPQQVLVGNLIQEFTDRGGDLRFEASEVSLAGLAGPRPTVGYRDPSGTAYEISCEFVAGCDGDHGVSRASVPEGELTAYPFDHGIAWLTVLADVPPPQHPLLAVNSRGYAAHFARGPRTSRFYLQCPPGTRTEDWPDDRVWEQVRARLGDKELVAGPITEKEVFSLRSVVHEPMSYGRLYLVGDAAHVVSPMGGKGMNLALYDAEVFARAVRDFTARGDMSGLDAYSPTCLHRTWNYQEFSRWMTEMLHDAGDDSRTGPFRRRLARARLDRLFSSPPAAAAFAELMAGFG
ncbi:p-hydroxybenzoate 3-monooxygenase [Streptomyces sp. DvalAA-14]|uniref:4-hydroxybenzoate 3-monooxygenase n=1 Tax=unclassified Streptomyces TaxID=2593676 RepID=UPI00081B2069|nr:4-hydroxybenzoate 3-monooxygenase [Streptomyces sp. DvalAA-14]MYS22212.1 4-hydroxybenzoate 3-monooxygenase [Streptomyces sp. SID4948]SCE11326.1 p-hydroxybenzoate 3-monooxygenase [Streptomyces sp. DvalAA-14]